MKLEPILDEVLKKARSVTSDSRKVGPGTVFVAVKGETHDGHDFISQAFQSGAVAVVGEWEFRPTSGAHRYFRVPDSRAALARIASAFHGNPSHSMKMIGVTGTTGKTTTTYLIESVLKAAGYEVGVIGTVNFRYKGKVLDATHTTPGAAELQALLAEMKAAGCTAVVMEVSSHALKLKRSACIAFDAVVFNNLSPEHLDFHPDMEDYFGAKALLFTDYMEYSIGASKKPAAAIHIGDAYGARLAAMLKERGNTGVRLLTFGMDPSADVSGSDLRAGLDGVSGLVGKMAVRSPLTGAFNAENILGAIAAAQGMGIGPREIERGISALPSVPGRLERVPNSKGIHVWVDYAHKSDALEKVLKALLQVKNAHRIITVFGCGGNRDRLKRPVMGRIAVEHSDLVFVTSDNPRTEDPMSIIHEIQKGVEQVPGYISKVHIEADRRRAIFEAISAAQPGDLVLIAGKGHEDYQIVADPSSSTGTRKIHFDDREVAAQALE